MECQQLIKLQAQKGLEEAHTNNWGGSTMYVQMKQRQMSGKRQQSSAWKQKQDNNETMIKSNGEGNQDKMPWHRPDQDQNETRLRHAYRNNLLSNLFI